MTWSEIETILGPSTTTDDLERDMAKQGEIRRGFWQLTENVWVLVGFGENGQACWVLTHDPESLPEHPIERLRRVFFR